MVIMNPPLKGLKPLPYLHINGKNCGQVRRHSFDILKGINNIKAAWEEVSAKCSNGVWHKLLPEFMHDCTGYKPVENIIETLADWS
jgi:hypothetical protein